MDAISVSKIQHLQSMKYKLASHFVTIALIAGMTIVAKSIKQEIIVNVTQIVAKYGTISFPD